MQDTQEKPVIQRLEELMIQVNHLHRGALILRDHQDEKEIGLYFAEELAEQAEQAEQIYEGFRALYPDISSKI